MTSQPQTLVQTGRTWPLMALMAITVLIYTPSLRGSLNQLDDYSYIVESGHYDRPLNATGLRQVFFTIAQKEALHDYYRPVYTLIRMIDYRLYGVSPTGYRVTNLLFYLWATWMVYLILILVVASRSAALLGAALFATHPVHVEAVAWIMAGGYAIAGAFALTSFYFYLRKRKGPCLLFFALAAFTNPPSVVLPVLIWGHDRCFPEPTLQGRRWRLSLMAILLVLAGFIAWLNLVIFPQHYAGVFFDTATAFRTALENIFRYTVLMGFPLGLHSPREEYSMGWGDPLWLAGVGLALIFVRGTFEMWRRGYRAAVFGLFWFILCLAPTVTIWKNPSTMAERYAFLASFGFCLACSSLWAARVEKTPDLSPLNGRWNKLKGIGRLPAAAFAVALLFFFASSIWRSWLWADSERLMTDTLRTEPGAVFAVRTLLNFYSSRRPSALPRTLPYIERCLSIVEDRLRRVKTSSLISYERLNLSQLKCSRAIVLRSLKRYDEAFREHEQAAQEAPRPDGDIYFQWALTYDDASEDLARTGQNELRGNYLKRALGLYHQAAEANPLSSRAYQNAGLILYQMGKPGSAVQLLKRALELSPNNLEVVGLLARAYLDSGERLRAQELARQALLLAERRHARPELLRELDSLSREFSFAQKDQTLDEQARFVALFQNQEYAEALDAALSLLKSSPNPQTRALNNVGLCYYKLKRYSEAESYYQKALKIDPDYSLALHNLALVYDKTGRPDLAEGAKRKAQRASP